MSIARILVCSLTIGCMHAATIRVYNTTINPITIALFSNHVTNQGGRNFDNPKAHLEVIGPGSAYYYDSGLNGFTGAKVFYDQGQVRIQDITITYNKLKQHFKLSIHRWQPYNLSFSTNMLSVENKLKISNNGSYSFNGTAGQGIPYMSLESKVPLNFNEVITGYRQD